MALFRRFFYKKPPDRLLEISERVYGNHSFLFLSFHDQSIYKKMKLSPDLFLQSVIYAHWDQNCYDELLDGIGFLAV